MQFLTYQPPPSLQQYVRFFWTLESDEAYMHHSMASGCPELIFHYKNKFEEINLNDQREVSFQSGLHAAGSGSRKFITDGSFGIFGAYLYPYAIPILTGESAETFTNQMIDLISLLGNSGRILEEGLMLAANNEERYSLLVQYLEKKLLQQRQSVPPVFHVIRQIIAVGGEKKVQELHADAYLSKRQFERKFLYYTGMAPKIFTRIHRFHKALELYGKDQSLTRIAYHCGYYDQSHFIHDFKEFSGHTPRSFYTGNAQNENWRDV